MLPARQRQRPDPVQHVTEQPPVQMPLGQQQPIIPGMLDQPTACLHQPALQARRCIHYFTLSRNGVSGKSGAVQRLATRTKRTENLLSAELRARCQTHP